MPIDGKIIIERAQASDADLVADLVHRLLSELAGGKDVSLEDLRTSARKLMAQGLVRSVIARLDENPVGVLCLNECAAIYAGGRFGEITELYVAAECRSLGIAPKLIEEAKQIGRESGWGRLEVGAPDMPAWERTFNFYLREGFEEVGPRLKLLI